MKLLSSIRKLFSRPSYLFGRFRTVRWLYSRIRGLTSRSTIASPSGESPYADLSIPAAVEEMRRTAYVLLRPLPKEPIDDLLAFSRSTRLKGQGTIGELDYRDVVNGKLPDGQPVAIAYVMDAERHPFVASLKNDPFLWELARQYLGYPPARLDVNLYWSFHVNMTEEERRSQNQTIDFHFDVHDFNFCYYHLYITDTDASNGAHVLVRSSHIRKPLRWLFGTARQSDRQIESRYPAGDIVTLEGKGGTAFFEDTSCYHKALPPASGERLLLQIRYH